MNIKDIKIPNSNFIVAEFVPTELYDGYRPNRFTRYCNLQLVEFAQDIRNHFGKSMTINNKVYGGPYNYRGYRYSGCNIGAPKGAHYRNCAIDFNIKGLTDLEVRQELVKNYKELNITILEDGMNGWCHAGFEWFMGHEQDLAVFDKVDNTIHFINDASNYKVKAG